MAIDGINVNVENWRNKPVKEVVNNLDIVQDEDSECAQWAQAMAAVTNAPDNVTYDMAGGSTEQFTIELDNITQNGLPIDEQPEDAPPEDVEGVGKATDVPPEEEEPDVGDVDETEDPEIPAPPEETPPETTPETDNGDEDTDNPDDLADNDITTDDETIRKRRQKRGETPPEG